jgi:hypothetical protein
VTAQLAYELKNAAFALSPTDFNTLRELVIGEICSGDTTPLVESAFDHDVSVLASGIIAEHRDVLPDDFVIDPTTVSTKGNVGVLFGYWWSMNGWKANIRERTGNNQVSTFVLMPQSKVVDSLLLLFVFDCAFSH